MIATTAVVALPVAAVLLLLAVNDPDPPLLAIAIAGTAVSIAVTVVGTRLWNHRPESADISFGELMLWSWARRWRAERRVREHAALLGLDEQGRRHDQPRVARDEQIELLRELTAALESKDPYTHGHSNRVERHAYRTGLALHLAITDLDDLRTAAALHDVGKIRVPDAILRNPESLTEPEWSVLQLHAVVGSEMVAEVGNDDVVAAVRHHHERWDGTGYPDGLRGAGIPLLARVIAVADAYDAMTSTRPYRPGLGRKEAVEELRAGAGRQFDPQVVDAFVSTLPLPLPIAALLPFFAGGRRVLSETAFFAKRTGTASITSSAAAAGAAIVIGAGGLAPTGVADPPPPREQSRSIAVDAAEPEVAIAAPRDRVVGKRLQRPGGNTRRRAEAAPTRITREAGRAAPQPVEEQASRDRDEGEQPKVVDRPARPAPEPPPKAERTPQRRRYPPTDPRPDKGRDCEPRSQSKGKGQAYHCGS